MHQQHRLRIEGTAAALVLFLGLGGCGGSTSKPTPVLASITLDASGSVTAGATIQGTATLNLAAAAGGAGVTLSSSNPSVATVQAVVVIAEGATSERFTVTGVATGTVTITGNFGGSQTANVTVNSAPIELLSVSVSPSSVSGLGTIQGTVRISGPAPSGGTTVGLSSSNANAASVPGSVTVGQGSTSQTFDVEVKTAVAANVTITGTLGNTSRVTNLAINSVPIIATFQMIKDAGSGGGANQCEVVRVDLGGGSSGNRMRCSFNASASTPQGGITTFIWRFGTGPTSGAGSGSMAFSRSTPIISGSEFTLPCGSFGASPPLGSVFDREVTLEIDTPGGKNEVSVMITFFRNGPCG